jgi:hypothetical protein
MGPGDENTASSSALDWNVSPVERFENSPAKAAAQGLRGEEANSADQLQCGCALRATGDECYGFVPLLKGNREEIT